MPTKNLVVILNTIQGCAVNCQQIYFEDGIRYSQSVLVVLAQQRRADGSSSVQSPLTLNLIF